MPRAALAAIATLLLNGSMAMATMPAPATCSAEQRVCEISLRMMTPPPPRPADLRVQASADANSLRIAATF